MLPATDAPSPTSPPAAAKVTPTATIGGVNAPVAFAGLTPGMVGLVQVNAQLPSTYPAVSSLPAQPLATLAADSSGRVIEIQDVVGPGDLNNEAVLLRRVGAGDLQLSGWKMDDGNGHSYFFPDFILNQDGAVQVNSRAGANTAIALFWNEPEAVWATGKTVMLYDPLGKLEAMFTIK